MCIVRTKQNVEKTGKQKINDSKKITYVYCCIHASFTHLLTKFHCASMFTVPVIALKALLCRKAIIRFQQMGPICLFNLECEVSLCGRISFDGSKEGSFYS